MNAHCTKSTFRVGLVCQAEPQLSTTAAAASSESSSRAGAAPGRWAPRALACCERVAFVSARPETKRPDLTRACCSPERLATRRHPRHGRRQRGSSPSRSPSPGASRGTAFFGLQRSARGAALGAAATLRAQGRRGATRRGRRWGGELTACPRV